MASEVLGSAEHCPARALELLQAATSEWAWESIARREQLPPEGPWRIWLICAGRGMGKTRAGAEWLARQALLNPGHEFAVVAPTAKDLADVCIEGPSGLLRALGLQRDDRAYNKVHGILRLPNGSTIRSYAAETPDRLRGPNLSGAWCDELGSFRYRQTWDEGLMPALRIGEARVVVTTTPRRTPLLRELLKRTDGSVHVTRGSTFDNAQNLSTTALEELRRRYEGTRLGRQELYGELIEDVEGALWTREMFEPRVKWMSDFDGEAFERCPGGQPALKVIDGGRAPAPKRYVAPRRSIWFS